MKMRNALRNAASVAAVLALLAASAAVTAPARAADEDPVRLHLIWTNDIHGHIAPEPARFMNPNFPPPLGGGASMAAYVKKVRAEAEAAGEDILLVDAGDIFQGAPVGTKTRGTAMVDFFDGLGYDALVPGNHDFDLGRENAERLSRLMKTPWVCANLRDESTGEIVDWCRPTMMIEKGGLKIGVIGIITPGTVAMAFPDNIEGLIFDPMAPVIERYRDELTEQGADLIMLLIHEGLPFDPKAGWREIAKSEETGDDASRQEFTGAYGQVTGGSMNLMELVHEVPGIDFAVGGHTHRGYQEPWIDPVNHTLCFETFGNGSSVGHCVLEIDRATKQIIGYEAPHDRGTIVTLFEDELWPDAEMTEVIRPHIEMTDAEMNKVVGSAKVNLTRGGPGSNLVGNMVTDAMREYFDADFSFQNLGGLRADIPSGDITARDVFGVLPFGNELVVVKMKGSMMRQIVERKVRGSSGGICVSGIEVVFNKNRPDMDRVCSFLVGGEPLDEDRIYRAVCTNFLLEGNSGLDFLTKIPSQDIERTQITTAESLERYLSLNSPVRPRIDNRWVEDPTAEQQPYLKARAIP